MTAIIEGELKLQAALNAFNIDMEKAVDDAVRLTAIKVEARAKKLILIPSQGKAYKKSKSVTHIASKEGDAPNTDTGRLLGSVTHVHRRGAKVAFVGTNLDYGAILETEKNRPWLEPAKEIESLFFSNNLKATMSKQVKKAGK